MTYILVENHKIFKFGITDIYSFIPLVFIYRIYKATVGRLKMTDFVFKFLVRAENFARTAKETVVAILQEATEKLGCVSDAVLNLIEAVLIFFFALPLFWIERFFRFLRQYFEFEKNFQKNFDSFKKWYNEQKGANNEEE